MNKEMKLLAKKLTALFLSLALVIGLVPGNVAIAAETEYSHVIWDYEDTYYNGFNDDVAVATGTFVELICGEEPNQIFVENAVAKEEGASYSDYITIDGNLEADAIVSYENGNVYIAIVADGEQLYKELLYTPKYVDITEMPTISMGQEIEVAGYAEQYCERYYRVDVSSASECKAYTIIEDDYTDTYMVLYNEEGKRVARNDDENDNTSSSAITFTMPDEGERIVGVRGYEYESIYQTTLRLVTPAKTINSVSSDNAEQLNTFYEGFNDDVLYATGTRITAKTDNDVESTWQAYGYYYDDEDEEKDGTNIYIGDVQATLYKGVDGAVYADYCLSDGSEAGTTKLFTPVIKQVSEMTEIAEGQTTMSTLPWEGAYTYYRLTAEDKDEVWNISFSCNGDAEEYSELYLDIYEEDGTLIEEYEQDYDDEYILADLEVEITVPAGTTKIIGVYDYENASQEYTLTATKEGDEGSTTVAPIDPGTEPTTDPTQSGTEPTTPDSSDPGTEVTTPDSADPGTEVTTPDSSDPGTETTTPESTSGPTICPTPPADTVETTTVAPATNNADEQKIATFKKAGKAKVKKAIKKKSAKKIKVTLKKTLKGVDGYQVRVYKTKKNAKKNKKAIVKIKVKKNKKKFTIKKKKLAKKKTLYIRVRGYIKVNGKTYTGKWSKVKKVKITK